MGERLGQHFLRDERVLDAVIAAAELAPGQSVLEVGPGPGNLTGRLARAVGAQGKVVTIEADKALATALQSRWPNVEVVEGDAVQTPLGPLGPFDRIVANLPYLISGPITIAFMELLRQPATRWARAVLMYQAEFADRLLAHAGDASYGRLSVHVSRWVKVTKVRDVSPGSFDPPPAVDSMVVSLEPHATAPFTVANEALWRAVVDGSFQQRRKKLRNTVPPAAARAGIPEDRAKSALAALGLEDERPEQVSPQRFAELVARMV